LKGRIIRSTGGVNAIGPQENTSKVNPVIKGPSITGNDIPVWSAIGFLIGIIFILDVTSPTRIVFWTLYILPLFLTLYAKQRFAHVVVAAVIVILVFAGIFLENPNVQIVNLFINRAFFSAVIAVIAYFIGNYRSKVAELRESREKLGRSEEVLCKHEAELTASLKEKEALLSEIHHRVKNNLTAFISLLTISGSSPTTPEGEALRVDLQNRARSMAIVHETLYETNNYSDVDMNAYLSSLTGQVVSSYHTTTPFRTLVDARGITLDLDRATPVGLIVTEFLTNSLKYAFPGGRSACLSDPNDPCTVRISLSKESGTYTLKVSDNGVGLPPGFDIEQVQSLGLKLVNFLAKHQLRAKVEVSTGKGAGFVIRFKE
jgi:two-component sensor histidine kinase